MGKPKNEGGPDRVAPIQTADDAEQSLAILHDSQEIDNPQDPRTLNGQGKEQSKLRSKINSFDDLIAR